MYPHTDTLVLNLHWLALDFDMPVYHVCVIAFGPEKEQAQAACWDLGAKSGVHCSKYAWSWSEGLMTIGRTP